MDPAELVNFVFSLTEEDIKGDKVIELRYVKFQNVQNVVVCGFLTFLPINIENFNQLDQSLFQVQAYVFDMYFFG